MKATQQTDKSALRVSPESGFPSFRIVLPRVLPSDLFYGGGRRAQHNHRGGGRAVFLTHRLLFIAINCDCECAELIL